MLPDSQTSRHGRFLPLQHPRALLFPLRSSYHVAAPWPGSSVWHKFSLVLSFLRPTIGKFAKQRIRRGCQERESRWVAEAHPTWPPSSGTACDSLSLASRCLTWYSRGCLDVFSIEVGDDGLTLLGGLHPEEYNMGQALATGGQGSHTLRRKPCVPSRTSTPEP